MEKEVFIITIDNKKTQIILDSKECIEYKKIPRKAGQSFFLINKAVKELYNKKSFWVGENDANMCSGKIFTLNSFNDLIPISDKISVSIKKI